VIWFIKFLWCGFWGHRRTIHIGATDEFGDEKVYRCLCGERHTTVFQPTHINCRCFMMPPDAAIEKEAGK